MVEHPAVNRETWGSIPLVCANEVQQGEGETMSKTVTEIFFETLGWFDNRRYLVSEVHFDGGASPSFVISFDDELLPNKSEKSESP